MKLVITLMFTYILYLKRNYKKDVQYEGVEQLYIYIYV